MRYTSAMFEIIIERTFCAAHAIEINGAMEPVHGHNWTVRATVEGDALDGDGLLLDFHALERHVDAVIQPLHNHSLNEAALLRGVNPTAELVAQSIAGAVKPKLPGHVRLTRVEVTEAPGCVAVWRA